MAPKIMTPVFGLLAFCIFVTGAADIAYTSKPGSVQRIQVSSQRFHRIYAMGVNNARTFMLQIHSQTSDITLCNSPIISHKSCTYGNNVGIYASTPQVTENDTVLWNFKVNSTLNETEVLVYLHVIMDEDPLPGGCNQVFNLENDPNVHVTNLPHHVRLVFQWASLPSRPEQSCESAALWNDLVYDIYASYLDLGDFGLESFFNGISSMVAPEDILDNGLLVTSLHNTVSSKPEVLVAAQSNRGFILSVVVRSKVTGQSAPYATVISYGCQLELGDCSSHPSAGEIVLLIVCFIVGLYLLLLGHRLFHFSQFVFGYMLTFLVVFLLMHIGHSIDTAVILGVACSVGVVGGVLCLVFWWGCFFPIASVMVPGLCAGYLVAATVYFTPFGNLDWWYSNENYALAFVCLILMFAVLLMAFTKFLSILSSCLVGAYLTLMVVAVPLGSSLRLVYLYSQYRQTQTDYERVVLVAPMEAQDIALLTLWPVLLVIGMLFQYYRERGRPAFERFEPKWRRVFCCRGHNVSEGERDIVYDTDTEATDTESLSGNNERSHLLPSPSRIGRSSRTPILPSYQSVEGGAGGGAAPRRMQEVC